MKALKNIKAGIPPRARLMIAASGIVVVVFSFGIIKMVSGPSDEARENPTGADLSLNPSQNQIGRYTPGDDIIIPENSEMARTIAAERDREMERALSTENVSLTESIVIPRSREQEQKAQEQEQEESNARALEELDQALAQRAIAEEQERRSRQRAVQPPPQTMGPVFDPAAWLDAELNRASTQIDGLPGEVERLVADASREIGSRSPSSSRAAQSRQQNESAVDTYINRLSGGEERRDNRPVPNTLAERLDHYYGAGAVESPGTSGQDAPGRVGATGRRMNAGTVLYAVLDTGINTDTTTDVRATIVQEGPFNGAVALGKVSRRGTGAVIEFNTLGLKGEDISISAVAIDPESDNHNTFLADKVDRHIIQRYGLLWASAFAEGFADALTNTTTTIHTDGSERSTSERLPDTRDQVLVATGKVGERTVPLLAQNFNRPPTVHVNSKRGIGLMLLSGVEY